MEFQREVHTHFPLNIRASNPLVSEPFPFLTEDALILIRQLLEKDEANGHCIRHSEIAPRVHRGLTLRSKFLRDLWSCPEISSAVSAAFGQSLTVHPMRYEQAHINRSDPSQPQRDTFGWHRDSQPYVFITLISDPGPEGDRLTQYYCGDELKSLVFPAAGWAYVMKGSEALHRVASNSSSSIERVSMVTAMVPQSPAQQDDTNLEYALQYSPALPVSMELVHYRLNRIKKLIEEEQQQQQAAHCAATPATTSIFTPSINDPIEAGSIPAVFGAWPTIESAKVPLRGGSYCDNTDGDSVCTESSASSSGSSACSHTTTTTTNSSGSITVTSALTASARIQREVELLIRATAKLLPHDEF